MACPFIDGTDDRCSRTLTLRNIQRAVSLCAYDHINCPVYQALKAGMVKQATYAKLVPMAS